MYISEGANFRMTGVGVLLKLMEFIIRLLRNTYATVHFLDQVGKSFSRISVNTDNCPSQPTARRPGKHENVV